jgi:hypothetical protein
MSQSLERNLLLHGIIMEKQRRSEFEAFKKYYSSHDPVPLKESSAARNNHGKTMKQ